MHVQVNILKPRFVAIYESGRVSPYIYTIHSLLTAA